LPERQSTPHPDEQEKEASFAHETYRDAKIKTRNEDSKVGEEKKTASRQQQDVSGAENKTCDVVNLTIKQQHTYLKHF
jgi:hypothetical protein